MIQENQLVEQLATEKKRRESELKEKARSKELARLKKEEELNLRAIRQLKAQQE